MACPPRAATEPCAVPGRRLASVPVRWSVPLAGPGGRPRDDGVALLSPAWEHAASVRKPDAPASDVRTGGSSPSSTCSESSGGSTSTPSGERFTPSGRALDPRIVWLDQTLRPLKKYGKGHVQLLVRGVLTYLNAFLTVLLVAHKVQVCQKSTLLVMQLINGTSLCHQFLTNDGRNLLVRSVASALVAASIAHQVVCGRRSYFAAFSDDSELDAQLAFRRARGYPEDLGRDTMICFTPRDLVDHDLPFMLPFRCVNSLNVLVFLGLSCNLFGHWYRPLHGAIVQEVLVEEAEVDSGSGSVDSAQAHSGGGKESSTDDPGSCSFSMPSPPTLRTKVVVLRGTTWLRGRMALSLCLAFLRILAAALKLTIVPDCYFTFTAVEITMHLIRGLLVRPLLALSFLTQFLIPT